MTVLPQLEAELLAAHARRAGQRRRPRARGGLAATLLASAVAVAVALFVLVSLRPGHHPRPSPSPSPAATPPAQPPPPLPQHPTRRQRSELDYIYRAEPGRVCADHLGRATPTVSQGSPDGSVLSILGVLRRPAQPSDRLPTRVVGRDHHVIPNGSLPPAHDIYVRYIRRARWRFGAGYYIVPAAVINPGMQVPAGCYSAWRAAVRAKLPSIPRGLRSGVLALLPRVLALQRYYAFPRPGVCLLALNDTGGGDGGCGSTVADIESGHGISSGGPTGVGVVYGIVPDGVATVTFSYPHHPALTARAIANVYIIRNPRQRLPNEGFPSRAVWRDAAGRVIKTIDYR